MIAGGRARFGATPPPAGVTVESLSSVLASDPEALRSTLGSAVESAQFAALNDALFADGVVIRIAANAQVDTPVHVVYGAQRGSAPTATYPRVLFIAEPSSRCSLVESFVESEGAGEARHLTNAVTEVIVRDGARVEHVRFTDGTERSLQLAYLGVRLGRDAFYGSRVVTLGGALSRLELTVEFSGPGAEVELDGAYHAGGRDHVDHHVRVEHRAPHCQSRVRYRGLLDGHGHAVFDAIGVVHKDAVGSAAHQENRNLLGSEDAVVHTKPHLEIECDDVTASHGATVGTLDAAQLFYLRSRGIAREEAEGILTYAFVREVIDRIKHPPLLQRASDSMLARLPNGDLLSEGAVS
ncbi:MAG TPA: Fe-S cluster assembly protein SufD [Polyangiaceae bacterium]|nr:Fe-S cluster assembly protein SufD [Polyangiaceae bacterium]